MSNNIVVIGSCMIDFVSYTPRLPQPGETVHGTKFVTNFGGKGANQCVAAAKLGGKTTLVARVGGDIWGSKYVEHLKSAGLNTGYIKITENHSTGIAQISVADNGENQIVIVSGANSQLNELDVKEARDVISSAAVVVLQLETPVNVALKALQYSKGISILNGAPALSHYDPSLLKLPTIFCVNESEASVFTGLPVTNVEEAEVVALDLLAKGCRSVLITLGPEGALYINSERKYFRAHAPKVRSIDTTGAGDAFIGALAYFLSSNNAISIENAITAACFVAADSVTKPGTQNSFPGPEILHDCIQLFN